ncbi:MAG: hypothetical protein MR885_07140 [Ruminococcus bromii]|jgi:hypothetical protein|nr:hypothetical protein [Ruminococcus bromii]
MALLAVVIILIIWLIIWIKDKLTPSNPPIDDIHEHCRIIQSLPDKKARQKYLKDLAKRK